MAVGEGGSYEEINVTVSGENVDIISDMERRIFKLTEERLKDAVSVQFGQPPDDVFLKSPTPWGDLYTEYGWKEVTITAKPISSVVVSKEFRNQTVVKQKYINNTSRNVVLNYKNKFMGHHFWAVEVADVLSIIGARQQKKNGITKEVIEMEFYTRTKQKLKVNQL
ncbi:uncharacterized protein LOC123720242 [Pieris brassicae]|uniref:uncharacterized protein LOC123720242 n=1 Tax=Pieris brassicae TaxID=7116 RepID=UPI001E65F4BB|nr:uncharacterized protein LOC123720242 [Pieris brassicae]